MIAVAVIVIGSSFAFFSTKVNSTKDNVIKAGKLEITYTDTTTSAINLTTAYPVSDTEGMKGTPHTFTIKNTGTIPVSYKVSFQENTNLYTSHKDTGKILGVNQLKLGITQGNNTTYKLYNKQPFIEGTLAAGASITYTVRLWIPETLGNEVQGYHFHASIKVDATQ